MSDGWTDEAVGRLRAAVAAAGKQAEVAEKSGVPVPTLQRILAGKVDPGVGRLVSLCEVAKTTLQWIVYGDECRTPIASATSLGGYAVPALTTPAAAGDGSLVWGDELGDGPFQFAEDWLRRLGPLNSLRLVQVSGDSQIPDLFDGDWVVVDTSQNKFENGLAVVLLDGYLMIKRLQAEGRFVQLISRHPSFHPITVDLSDNSRDLKIIGKAVYVLKRPN